MLKKFLYGTLMLIFLVTPALVMGQGMMPGKWWYNPQVSKELNLSKDEISRLEKSYRDSRRKLIDLKSSVERERFELENLLEDEAIDEAVVKNQFRKLEKEREKLASERFDFVMNVRKIMGKERFRKMKMFHEKTRHDRSRYPMGTSRGKPGPKK
jgi:Spy/CpxP family protein refolding chaperone